MNGLILPQVRTLELFNDQQEVMTELSNAMRKYKAILLQSPTGSGKTAMAIWMIMKCLQRIMTTEKLWESKIIFTVPRKDLLEQTSETLLSYGLHHSFIASGKPFNPTAKIMLGMVDTMANRIIIDNETGEIVEAKLPKGYIVIVDETHFGAEALGRIIAYYKSQGCWVIGLSATPWKLNGQGLGCWYDYMVMGKSLRWLIENNRLSDYDYYYGRTKPDLSKIKVTGGDYAKGELAGYMEEQGVIIGDCVTDYKERCMGNVHIVRCASIRHSEMVAATFRESGITFVHVDGNTAMDERKRIFKAYARREILGLTFCDLLNFGFDLSQASGMDVSIESCSDLKPSKSLAAQMQFWGRSLRRRKNSNEKFSVINDHVNNYIEHSFPCSDRDWTLEDRKKGAGGGGGGINTKQCGNDLCRHVHYPAPLCPKCGYVYTVIGRDIDVVDGELVKADKEAAKAALEAAKRDKKTRRAKAKSMDELIAFAQEEGYKNPAAWAARWMNLRKKKA